MHPSRQARSLLRRLATALLAPLALAAAEGQYLGAEACAACHAEQASAHAVSAHARALSRPADHRLAAKFGAPRRLARAPGFQFEIAMAGSELTVAVSHGALSRRVVAEWAFGAGDQAVTFVSQADESRYVEHHFSYYSGPDVYARRPANAPGGRPRPGRRPALPHLSPQTEIMSCFRCHTTGPLELGDNYSIRPSQLGVRCEACHGPARPMWRPSKRARPRRSLTAIANPDGSLRPS